MLLALLEDISCQEIILLITTVLTTVMLAIIKTIQIRKIQFVLSAKNSLVVSVKIAKGRQLTALNV